MFFLLILVVCLTACCGADNPTAIVAPRPGPDPGYIVAESDAGLSNRLRVLAGYMYVGEARFNNAHLVFIWDVNAACPGHYLEIFEPIPKVLFATNESRYVVDKHSKINYENSWAVLHWTLQMNGIPKNRYGHPTWGQIEHNMYSKFIPTPRIKYMASEYIKKHDICNVAAMHIRLTDLEDQIKAKRKAHRGLNIEAYMEYVENQNKVFLLTDNPDTQKLFMNKYPDKIIVYDRISAKGNGTDKPVDFRYTSLEHTIIDVLVAAHAKKFKPSLYSSLSDLVGHFRDVGSGWKWCETDEGS